MATYKPIVDWHDWPVEPEIVEQIKAGPCPEGGNWRGDGRWKRAFLHLLDEACAREVPYPEGKFAGRGIVSCVSAKSGWSSGKFLAQGYFPGAWVLGRELRELGCTLPITFAYLGFEEVDARLQQLAADLGASTFDMRWHDWFVDPMRILAGWETKIYAILHAPFEEVMFLDADNVPARDPTYLFDAMEYERTGAVFWPDLPPSRRGEWVPPDAWHSVGLPYRDYIDFESGQLVINKRKCWHALQVCRCINEHSDYWYKLVFGDKTTYFLAWQKLCQDYAMPAAPAGWTGRAIVQHDFSGKMIFQHACQDKPTLEGYSLQGYLKNHSRCNDHIAELRQQWDGHLWHHGEGIIDASIAGEYQYERHGLGDPRPLELLPNGDIGQGRADCEWTWRVHPSLNHGTCLVIYRKDNAPIAVFARADDRWFGQWIQFEKCRCTLWRSS